MDNVYLNTPLGRFEYMVIKLGSLSQETIKKYDLIELSQEGKVYIKIQKGMYGLPQAGILTNELLQHNLAKDGYRPTTHKTGTTRNAQLTYLCQDTSKPHSINTNILP
jgi:hypothetical protein